jgi:hypothetical protein
VWVPVAGSAPQLSNRRCAAEQLAGLAGIQLSDKWIERSAETDHTTAAKRPTSPSMAPACRLSTNAFPVWDFRPYRWVRCRDCIEKRWRPEGPYAEAEWLAATVGIGVCSAAVP